MILTSSHFTRKKGVRDRKGRGSPIPHPFLPEHGFILKLISELLSSSRLIKVHDDDVKSGSQVNIII